MGDNFSVKTCKHCKIEKPLTDFRVQRKTAGGGGRNVHCNQCLDSGKRHKSARKTVTYEKNREYFIRRKYGLEHSQYDEILISQDGRCAICKSEDPGPHRKDARGWFAIDHCHSDGGVRGLLCHSCNKGLGMFKDNIETLANAIKYLEKT